MTVHAQQEHPDRRKKDKAPFAFSAFSGLVLGGLLVAGGARLGDGLFHPGAALVFVLLGALVAVWLAHSLRDGLRLFRLVGRTLYRRSVPAETWSEYMFAVCWLLRRSGLPALEPVQKKAPDALLCRGLQFFADGVDTASTSQILESEIDSMEEKHRADLALAATVGLGGVAFGLVGLVLGLWSGQSLQAAVVPLWWGVAVGGLFYLLRCKLRERNSAEALQKRIIKEAIVALQEGDNPYIVLLRQNTLLPPAQRLQADELSRQLDG